VKRQRPTWLWTVLASGALHAAALWLLSTGAQAPSLPASRPLELTWVETEASPAPAPQPPVAVAVAAPVKPTRQAPPPSKADPAPARTEANAGFSGGQSASTGGSVAEPGTVGDVPVARGVNLTPGLGGVLKMPEAADAEPSHGTTVRNGPGEEPDPVAAREYEGEVLSRRLTGDLQRELGSAALAVGSVPGHFRAVESSMREVLRNAPVEVTPKSAREVAQDVARMLLASPGASAEAARKVTDSPLGRSLASGSVPLPNAEDQRFREQAMQMMGATEALKEKLSAPQLRTVLELTCDPTGALADVTVIEKSGDPRFDESVMHLSRKVFRSLPDNDEKGLGASWWRTRWQFTFEPPAVKVRLIGAHRVPPT
jgi:outer membrane biosynthesis protein TonB